MSGRPGLPKQLGSIRARNSVDFRNSRSLRRNNPTQRVTPGQHDAAMIHLRWGQRWMILYGKSGSLDQRPAAGRTPIRHGLFAEHRPALAANPFHTFKITGLSHTVSAMVPLIKF